MHWLLNLAAFYLGWFVCVVGAARGQLWLGPALVAAFLLAHVYRSRDPRHETRLILVVALFGFTFDTLLASAGLFSFARTSIAAWLSPPWMVALWMIFATTLNASLAWLDQRRALAAALGALSGPASYVAGARLGAIELPANALASLIGLALAWAFAMPALLWINQNLRTSAPCASSK